VDHGGKKKRGVGGDLKSCQRKKLYWFGRKNVRPVKTKPVRNIISPDTTGVQIRPQREGVLWPADLLNNQIQRAWVTAQRKCVFFQKGVKKSGKKQGPVRRETREKTAHPVLGGFRKKFATLKQKKPPLQFTGGPQNGKWAILFVRGVLVKIFFLQIGKKITRGEKPYWKQFLKPTRW